MSRHCSTCTCGYTKLEWSDRDTWVRLEDHNEVADIVIACALDHSYDRGYGVPFGLPDKLYGALLPIVAKHLSAVNPKWEDETIYSFSKARIKALKIDLIRCMEEQS